MNQDSATLLCLSEPCFKSHLDWLFKLSFCLPSLNSVFYPVVLDYIFSYIILFQLFPRKNSRMHAAFSVPLLHSAIQVKELVCNWKQVRVRIIAIRIWNPSSYITLFFFFYSSIYNYHLSNIGLFFFLYFKVTLCGLQH